MSYKYDPLDILASHELVDTHDTVEPLELLDTLEIDVKGVKSIKI